MNHVKCIARLLCIGAVALLHTTMYARPPVDEIERLVEAYARSEQFSGSVLVARNGEVLMSRGFGMANYELGVPNTPQTVFRLGSVTKQFTAAAVLQLQERGALSVHDPLSTFFPDYPGGDSITVHHLLNHTSGIPNFTSYASYHEEMREAATLEEVMARFRDSAAEFRTGERYKYSNSNYVLLTAIVEKVSGESYGDYLQRHIFDPLGMTSTGIDDHRTIIPNRASGYTAGRDGLINADFIDMSVPSGAGAMYSTVEDLYRWDRALAEARVLKRASLEAMFTPGKGNYGYGWVIEKEPRTKLWHNGGINGFTTIIARYPDSDACIIVLGNFEHGEPGDVLQGIQAVLFGEPYSVPVVRTPAAVDTALYRRYVGDYELVPGFVISISTDNGRLLAQATGQQQFEIYPESDTTFFYKVVDAQVEFVLGGNGRATALILHQNGVSTQGRRLPVPNDGTVESGTVESGTSTNDSE